jgi:membrane protease YdiL (CAAX protease family)
MFSFKAQASPRLYAIGMLLGLPAIVALLGYMVAATTGFKLTALGVPAWVVIEIVCVIGSFGLVSRAVAQGRQRRIDGWQDYAGPSPLLTMGALLATVTALQIPLEMGLKSLHVDLQSAGATLAITLTYLAAYVGLVYFLAVRPRALSWRDIVRPALIAPSSDDWGSSEPQIEGPRRIVVRTRAAGARLGGSRIGHLLVPVALVVPLMLVSNLVGMGMLLVLGLKASDISPDSVTPVDAISRLVLLIAVAGVVPVGEELFFRGFATNAWSRSMGRNSAILRASLFFAFVHVMNTPSSDIGLSWRVALFNFGARVPVAFALTWLYMRRRSIFASGTLHAGYNGLITLIGFIAAT